MYKVDFFDGPTDKLATNIQDVLNQRNKEGYTLRQCVVVAGGIVIAITEKATITYLGTG